MVIGQVLVELVPTFSFALCFTRARILATPALCNFASRCLWHTAYTLQLPRLVVCAIYVSGVYCRARLGVVSQGSCAGLTIFTSVCISWYGKQLITITSDLVSSNKQISRIGTCSLIGGRQQQLSICLS